VLYFGTPPQALKVNFETRSGWVFLFDASCVRDDYNEARSFHSTKSSTFESTDEVYELDGDGAVALAYDSASLGYAEGRVLRQTILLITEDRDYWSFNGDGVVVSTRQGLAASSLSDGHETMLDNLKSQNVIDRKVFAFFLSQEDDFMAPMPSVSFGSWDLAAYALTDFTYLPVDSELGDWTVPITGFRVGSTPVYSIGSASLDPNDYDIYLPSYAYRSFRRTICSLVTCDTSSYSIEFECDNNEIELLPDLVFELNGVEFSLSTKFYVKNWGWGDPCQMNVQESYYGQYDLGIPFMQAYYTLFDAETNRIGLARSVNYPYLPTYAAAATEEQDEGSTVVLAASVVACALILWGAYRRRKTVQSELTRPLLGNSA